MGQLGGNLPSKYSGKSWILEDGMVGLFSRPKCRSRWPDLRQDYQGVVERDHMIAYLSRLQCMSLVEHPHNKKHYGEMSMLACRWLRVCRLLLLFPLSSISSFYCAPGYLKSSLTSSLVLIRITCLYSRPLFVIPFPGHRCTIVS
jgi:hypothetical protein